MQSEGMNPMERRAAVSLAVLYATRMLGLFMIIPVFPFFAQDMPDYTPHLMGLAIGIYGLTQAAMQIPMGILSDRVGRKRVIAMGFFMFAAGSLVAAAADNLWEVVLGRALQGSGAVAAVLMALAADLSSEEHRTKVMGTIGASIGLAFACAMVLGPLLDNWIGVPGLFLLTAAMAVLGLIALKFWVPDPRHSRFHRDAEPVLQDVGLVLRDGELLRLNTGIFVLHFVLTSCFVVLPLALHDAGLLKQHHWAVYLPVIVAALGIMIPFIISAEKRRRMKRVYVGAIGVLTVTVIGFAFAKHDMVWLVALMVLFFTCFNILEASLPSLLVKTVSPEKKGTAMGMYSSSQFIGAFMGGWVGGHVYGLYHFQGVFLMAGLLLAVWFLLALGMRNPRYLTSFLINVGEVTEEQAKDLVIRITQVRGVAEAVVVAEEGVAYLKVDKHALDTVALGEFSAAEA